jgi:hypothetical protein
VLYEKFSVKMLRHERLELYKPGENSGKHVLAGPLIGQHMGSAEEVVVMLCTIGETLEQISGELMVSDPMQGWAMDGLGSAATEALVTAACNYFEDEGLKRDLQATIPLSPGMIGWPIDQGQPQIFQLLNSREIGIALTSSYLMMPRKSISTIIGFGINIGTAGKTCDFCNMKDTCRYQNHYASISN